MRIVFIILICFIFDLAGNSLRFSSILVEGLKQTTIKSITQDNYGFLWVATRDGLVRYNGCEVQLFSNIPGDSSSLPDNAVNCIKKLNDGRLLVGTQFSGLALFNFSKENFKRFSNSSDNGSIRSNQVMDIFQDSQGAIWIGTWKGLEKFDLITGKFQHFEVPDSEREFEGKNFVSSIAEDKNGNIWLFCQGNRISVLAKGETQIRLVRTLGSKNEIKSTGSLLVDSENALWVGNFAGTYRYSLVGTELVDLPGKYNEIKGTYVRDILEDQQGYIWLGTDGNGLYQYARKEKKMLRYLSSSLDPASISSNAISCMFESSPGNLWIGTYSGGLNACLTSYPEFLSFSDIGNSAQVLTHKSVLSFTEFQDKVILGTDGGGVNEFNPTDQTFRPWPFSSQLHSNIIKCIYSDSEGKIWMGSFKGGLSMYDPSNKRIKNFVPVEKTNSGSIHHNNVWSLAEDKSGNIWIGLLGEGLDVYNKKRNSFTHYPVNGTNGLADGFIHVLFTDREGTVWIGTERGGLHYFDSKKNKFKAFQFSSTNASSISGNSVKSIFQDKNGMLWIGTEHNGLCKLIDKEQGVFERIRNSELPNTIHSILEDSSSLWLGSGTGLYQYFIEKNKVLRYDKLDGLQGDVFATGSAFVDSKRGFYWGGPNGVSYLKKTKTAAVTKEYPVYINEIRLFNQPLKLNGDGELALVDAAYRLKTISFAYHENVLSFIFSTPEFKNPGKRLYGYKLEGFDKEWILTDAQHRTATYTNLSPGNYKLRVRVKGSNGDWSDKEAVLTISVLPPWWMTWWFRVMAIVGTLSIIGLIFYIRVKNIEKRNQELTREVEIRTRDLKDANLQLNQINGQIREKNNQLNESNEEIRQQNEKILIQQTEIVKQKEELEKANQTKDKLFSVVSHDLRNPANALKALAELLSRADLTTGKEKEEIIHRIHSSSKALSHLVNNILDWARTQISGMNPVLKEVVLNDLILETIQQVKTQAESKRIELILLQDAQFTIMADPTMMSSVVRNILSNAVKFTPQFGKIEIALVELSEQGIMISIQDNGIGMTDAQKALLFDLQKNSYTLGTSNEIGSGIGMSITHEFVRLHNGSIEVFSNPGEGTRVTVLLQYKSKLDLPEVKPELHQVEEIQLLEEEYASVKGKKLLIVEDDETTREVLKRTFSDMFELYEAQDGNTAYYQTITHMPDIIISDIRMPNADGYELCKRLKDDPQTSHTAIFLITSEDSKESQLKAFQSGADDYFPKPLSKEILLAKITSYFENLEKKIRQFTGEEEVPAESLTSNKVDKELLGKIIAYIEANISDAEMNADVICREVSVSRAVLYRKLKNITGQSVNEFIRIIRLKKSISLLKEGELNISQVAYEVGFNSLSYFTRSFKNQFGKNPSEYMKG